MPQINEETLNKFSNLQNQIWQSVSITASEAAGQTMTFGSPLSVATTTNDLFAEMASPKLIIQFALADMPEHSHVILLNQETFSDIAAMAQKVDPMEIQEVDENLLSEARPILESIVQGVCVAVGNIKGAPLIATGLTIRFQIFNFPPSIQSAEHVVRTNVAIASDVVNGTLTWICDTESVVDIAGKKSEGEQEFNSTIEEITARDLSAMVDETPSLEILMDIPMEISVELGRVRLQIKDVVDLGSGSIVEIEKAAGDPVDVLVNGRLVARGEVVVIEDNFGVRITEILSPAERLARLQEAS
jgi:flagellar motor switch protein FliN/FliY